MTQFHEFTDTKKPEEVTSSISICGDLKLAIFMSSFKTKYDILPKSYKIMKVQFLINLINILFHLLDIYLKVREAWDL